MSIESSELASWRITAYLMVILSFIIFITQRFIYSFIDPIFEVCIFHIPALVASLAYYRGARGGDQKGK
ncbi:hypothetical protein KEJ49_07765 [Candidatus Bathyarchaeota archaeon]|nr:hypothetical protein [Candidatus Bathyarchaeota archaeon]